MSSRVPARPASCRHIAHFPELRHPRALVANKRMASAAQAPWTAPRISS